MLYTYLLLTCCSVLLLLSFSQMLTFVWRVCVCEWAHIFMSKYLFEFVQFFFFFFRLCSMFSCFAYGSVCVCVWMLYASVNMWTTQVLESTYEIVSKFSKQLEYMTHHEPFIYVYCSLNYQHLSGSRNVLWARWLCMSANILDSSAA